MCRGFCLPEVRTHNRSLSDTARLDLLAGDPARECPRYPCLVVSLARLITDLCLSLAHLRWGCNPLDLNALDGLGRHQGTIVGEQKSAIGKIGNVAEQGRLAFVGHLQS